MLNDHIIFALETEFFDASSKASKLRQSSEIRKKILSLADFLNRHKENCGFCDILKEKKRTVPRD